MSIIYVYLYIYIYSKYTSTRIGSVQIGRSTTSYRGLLCVYRCVDAICVRRRNFVCAFW